MDGCHTTHPHVRLSYMLYNSFASFFFFFSPIFPQWDGRNSDRQQKKKRCKKREKSPSISQLVCVAFCGRHTQVRATTHTPQSFFYYLFIYLFLPLFLILTTARKKRGCINPEKGRNIDIISSKTVVECTAARRVCDGAEMKANAVLKRFDKLEEEKKKSSLKNKQLAFFLLTFQLTDCLLVSGSTIGKIQVFFQEFRGGKLLRFRSMRIGK